MPAALLAAGCWSTLTSCHIKSIIQPKALSRKEDLAKLEKKHRHRAPMDPARSAIREAAEALSSCWVAGIQNGPKCNASKAKATKTEEYTARINVASRSNSIKKSIPIVKIISESTSVSWVASSFTRVSSKSIQQASQKHKHSTPIIGLTSVP